MLWIRGFPHLDQDSPAGWKTISKTCRVSKLYN